MSISPELAFIQSKCNKCGKCEKACLEGAIVIGCDGMPQIDRGRCTACGECVKVCAPEAFVVYGKRYSIDEVLEEVRRDKAFYKSEGGVTLSGGEALDQAPFAAQLLRRCKEDGISTAIETTGFSSTASFRKVLKFTDLVLFDLKHMDDKEYRKLTGRSNSITLEHARLAVKEKGVGVLFRRPSIPTLNDSPEEIRRTAEFIRELQGDNACIELMPYHRFGVSKYAAVGKAYPLEHLPSATPEDIRPVREAFEKLGVRCLVSG